MPSPYFLAFGWPASTIGPVTVPREDVGAGVVGRLLFLRAPCQRRFAESASEVEGDVDLVEGAAGELGEHLGRDFELRGDLAGLARPWSRQRQHLSAATGRARPCRTGPRGAGPGLRASTWSTSEFLTRPKSATPLALPPSTGLEHRLGQLSGVGRRGAGRFFGRRSSCRSRRRWSVVAGATAAADRQDHDHQAPTTATPAAIAARSAAIGRQRILGREEAGALGGAGAGACGGGRLGLLDSAGLRRRGRLDLRSRLRRASSALGGSTGAGGGAIAFVGSELGRAPSLTLARTSSTLRPISAAMSS